MKAFGVGSLWFDLANKNEHDFESTEFDIDSHIDKIRKALGRIPSISEIEIQHNSEFGLIYSDYNLGDKNYQYSFFPFIAALSVRFKIHIPERIQEEIYHFGARNVPEDFHVSIDYGIETPVAIVSYDVENLDSNPSNGVVIVRKYLENQIPKEDLELTFNTLGPSPFHADFFLVADANMKEVEGLFSVEDISTTGYGYGKIVTKFDSEFIENDNLALQIFLEYYQKSIEIYYRSVLFSYDLMYITQDIERYLADLLEAQRSREVLAPIKRIYRSPRYNREIMLSVLELESKKLEMASHIEDARNRRGLVSGSIFEKYITEREIANQKLPIDDIRNTIRLFEDRYLKGIENATVVVAGILGGLIGSAITYLIGKQ